ncbi:hypothetical protein ACS0TY_029094 [Phlomoides rotata]
MMGTTKFDIEKFSGNSDFGLWRIKMKALLVQQGLSEALTIDTTEESSEAGGERAQELEKAHITIILCLRDKVLREVAKEKTAKAVWEKLATCTWLNPLPTICT